MKRFIVLTLAVVALLGTMAPAAFAQAPPAAPALKFDINGFLDTVTSFSHNLRDLNFTRTGDTEWYARNRGRFNIEGRVGNAVVVWGIEIDAVWGQTGALDNNLSGGGVAAQRSGANGAFDLNTDVQGIVETKWLFAEFDMPLMPFATRVRVGAQPYSVTYKICALACSDFAGVNLSTTWSPNVKSHITFAMIEEELHGPSTGGGATPAGLNGDDFAFIASVEISPFKGLDIRPIYSYAMFQGTTSAAARQPVSNGVVGGVPTFGPAVSNHEIRHTVGVDVRWRSGPFSVEPTALYQFGRRDMIDPFSPVAGTQSEADISAFLVDLKTGWRIGPLLLEFRAMYTTGNRPKDQLTQNVNYFQPITGDTGWWSDGWGNIFALGVDYFNGAFRTLGTGIGLDRYGRQQVGLKATYSLTPQLDFYGLVTPAWTARSVDTDGTFTPVAMTCRPSDCQGDDSYLGTEANLGLVWRFAPGLQLDLVGAYLFAGPALDTTESIGGVLTKRSAENVYTGAARLRVSF